MDEEKYIEKRFLDLSKQAQRKCVVTFSDFLTLNELDILSRCRNSLESGYEICGGYKLAERQMVAFLPDALYYDWEYPMSCIKITYSYPKFAEKLTHRDVLGSLMNLGIERSKTGDILFDKENSCIYLFVTEQICDYILENFTRIRHTEIRTELCTVSGLDIEPSYEEKTGIIASQRIDCIVACIANVSRSEAVRYIQSGKIFINGQTQLNNSYQCNEGEIISVRSVGKFLFEKVCGTTQKGKVRINYKKYI